MYIWHSLTSTYPQSHQRTCKDAKRYFWWDRSWQRAASFSVGVLVFTIVIVFSVQECIKYWDSSNFHYHTTLLMFAEVFMLYMMYELYYQYVSMYTCTCTCTRACGEERFILTYNCKYQCKYF